MRKTRVFNPTRGGSSTILTRLFLIICIFVFLFASVSSAVLGNGGVTVQGDLPQGNLYRVEMYDQPQTVPCDATADAGNLLAMVDGVTGDIDFQDNDDYIVTNSTYSGSNVYLYYCIMSLLPKLVLRETITTAPGTFTRDIGLIEGTSVHADLSGNHIIVCDDLNGNKLSTEDSIYSQVGGVGTSSYSQHYHTNGLIDPQIYALFDTNATPNCTFDLSISTGKMIDITLFEDNYGIYVYYQPSTKVSGDLHTDMQTSPPNADRVEVYDNGRNRGLAPVNGDCNNSVGSGDDYTLYYYNPASSPLEMWVWPGSSQPPMVTEIFDVFGNAGRDALVKIFGSVPSDITKVSMTAGGFTYETVPDASDDYALYVADGLGSQTVQFWKGGQAVFNKTVTVGTQSSEGCTADIEINISKVSGEAHSDLETGDDTLQVFDNSSCSNQPVSNAITPVDQAGPDYEIYFEETIGSGPYYMQAVMNDGGDTFSSCGNQFSVASEKTGHDIIVEVWGYVPDDVDGIQTIGISLDDSYELSYTNNDVYGQVDLSTEPEEYHLFSVPDDDTSAIINFYKKPGWSNNLAVYREKNLQPSSDLTVPVHIAKVKGNLYSGFAASGAADRVFVYSEFPVGSQENLMADDSPLPGKYLFSSSIYALYFEVTPDSEEQGVLDDGDVAIRFESDSGHFTWRTKVDKDPTTAGLEALTGGESISLNFTNEVTGTTHSDVSYIALVDGASWNPAIAETNGSSPSTYKMYFDDLTASSGNWSYFAHTNPLVLRRDQSTNDSSCLDGDVFNVGRVSGDNHPELENEQIDVCDDDVCTEQLSSEPTIFITSYKQYFEADSADPLNTSYCMMVDDEGFVTYGNCFLLASDYDADQDLVIEKTGNVTSDIVEVAVDLDQDSSDEAYTQSFVSAEYRLFSVPDNDTAADVHYYDVSGLVFTLVDDFSLDNSHKTIINNVDALIGDVDTNLGNGTVLIFEEQGGECADSDFHDDAPIASDPKAQSPDFRAHMEADGSTYWAVFCDVNGRKVLEWPVTSSTTGSVVHEMNVGEVAGFTHPFLWGFGNSIEVFRNMSDAETCNSSLALSTVPAMPVDHKFDPVTYYGYDYAVFFYQPEPQAEYVKKIKDWDPFSNQTYVIFHFFNTTEKGDTVLENLKALKYGIVETELGYPMDNVTITKEGEGRCELYDEEQCWEIEGCEWFAEGECMGEETPCMLFTEEQCMALDPFCFWNGVFCDGFVPCPILSPFGQYKCEVETEFMCHWMPFGPGTCVGTPFRGGKLSALTHSLPDGTYRIYDEAGVYNITYEKTGWVDKHIDNETLWPYSPMCEEWEEYELPWWLWWEWGCGEENNISMLYTLKINVFDELNQSKFNATVNVTNSSVTLNCTDGTRNIGNPPVDCDADTVGDGTIYWAFDPSSMSMPVSITEALDGYVDFIVNNVTIDDQHQEVITTHNKFTIRVIDVFNELGMQLDLNASPSKIGDATVFTDGQIANPTGVNFVLGNVSVYGDPRGDGAVDVFMPVMGSSMVTLTAIAPGYVNEDIEVTPDHTKQQLVMWGDWDRNCTEGQESWQDPVPFPDYCDDDIPKRLDGDGLLYTLKIDVWDELEEWRIKDVNITVNPVPPWWPPEEPPYPPEVPEWPFCYTNYLDREAPPEYNYDDDQSPDDFPHADYDYDPETEMYYLPVIDDECIYELTIKKPGYVTRAPASHGVSTRPENLLSHIYLDDEVQSVIIFNGTELCWEEFDGYYNGTRVAHCSGMPYNLKVNGFDQYNNPVEGITVVVEDAGLTLPPAEDLYFCWIDTEIVWEQLFIDYLYWDEYITPEFYPVIGPQSYKECVENGGIVMPINMRMCGSYSFEKQFKPEEMFVYDFGFCPEYMDGVQMYYPWWNSYAYGKYVFFDEGLGYYFVYGEYCDGGYPDEIPFYYGDFIDIFPDRCINDYDMRPCISDMDCREKEYCAHFIWGEEGMCMPKYGKRLFISGNRESSNIGYTNTWVITDGEPGSGLEPSEPSTRLGTRGNAMDVICEHSYALSPSIDLTNLSDALLSFDSWAFDEGGCPDFDAEYIEVSTDGGFNWTPISLCPEYPLHDERHDTSFSYDLTPFAGNIINLRFRYNTIDGCCGFEEGWYIDNVMITSGSVTLYFEDFETGWNGWTYILMDDYCGNESLGWELATHTIGGTYFDGIVEAWMLDYDLLEDSHVYYPLDPFSVLDNPTHIHISKPGFEADTKDGIIIDSLYQVVIDALLVDNIPPESHVVSPEEGDWLAGTVQITVDAYDAGSGVGKIEFLVDGAKIGEDTDHSDKKWNWSSWDTTNETDGAHDLTDIACDINGYCEESDIVTVFVDNTAPNCPSDLYHSYGQPYDNDGVVTWAWGASSDDGVGIDYYKLQLCHDMYGCGPNIVVGPSGEHVVSYTVSDLIDGNYTAYLSVVDKLGHEQICNISDSVIVDTILPEIIDVMLDDNTVQGGASIGVTVETDDSATSVTADGVSLSSASTTWTGTITAQSAEGTHSVSIEVCDIASNCVHDESAAYTVDDTPPSTPALISPVNGTITNDQTPTFVWGESLDESGIQEYEIAIYIPTIDETVTTTSFTPATSLAEGSHTWMVRARDNADNWGSWTDSYQFTIDITPPVLSSEGPEGTLNTNAVVLTVTTNEEAVCKYSKTDVSFDDMGQAMTHTGSNVHQEMVYEEDGTHTYYFACRDQAGNEASGVSTTFTVDTTSPVITDSAPQGFQNSTPSITVETATAAHCKWDIVDRAFANMSYWFDTTGATAHTDDLSQLTLDDGIVQIYFRCADDSNGTNTMQASGIIMFVLDREKPIITIIKPVNSSATNDNTVQFRMVDTTSGIDLSTISVTGLPNFNSAYCSENGLNGYDCAYQETGLSQGSNTITIDVYDKAGNIDPATSTFTYDTQAPTCTVDSLATYQDSLTFTVSWSGSDPAPSSGIASYDVQYKEDTGTWTDWVLSSTSDSAIFAGTDGKHYYFRCSTKDNAANKESLGASEADTIVDVSPPSEVTLTATGVESEPYDTDGNYQLTWTGGSDTNFDRYDIEVDGVITASVTSPYTGDSSEGEHTYKVIAYDLAGLSTESNEVKVFVDTIPPNISVDTQTAWPPFGWMFEYSVDDDTESSGIKDPVIQGGLHICSFSKDSMTGSCVVAGWVDELNISVEDMAGWSAMASVSREVDTDFTAPVVINSSPSGVLEVNNVTLEVWTDENATCRYDTETMEYNIMANTFTTTGSTYHSESLNDSNDGMHVYYVRCNDTSGNVMTVSEVVVFVVDTGGNYGFVEELTPEWDMFFLPEFMLTQITNSSGPFIVEDVLASLNETGTPSYTIVWYCGEPLGCINASDWKFYSVEPGMDSLTQFNDTAINPYWIRMTIADRLEIS